MIILGIDPGLATIGYGVVDYSQNRFKTLGMGAILTPAGLPVEERLSQIFDGMTELIEKYNPREMAVEELFFNTNHTTAISVAEARGVILLAARRKNVKIYEYTPLQVKQSVVGYGRAEKKQVIQMVKIILKLEKGPKLDDTADALALAICHAHCNGSGLQRYYNIK